MSALTTAFPVSSIRHAEEALLKAQSTPDELMRQAAHAVAIAAQVMLQSQGWEHERILVIAGSGGNGGDGLYAGAALAAGGYQVDALRTFAKVHERALEAFLQAGGRIIDDLQHVHSYSLIIDAISGIGSRGVLNPELATFLAPVKSSAALVLAVDIPSGINPDTGRGEAYFPADVTITFGGLKFCHALSTSCGEIICVDLAVGGQRMSTRLESVGDKRVSTSRALPYPDRFSWPNWFSSPHPQAISDVTPGPSDHKYSGGVVGIAAGSAQFPGAGFLAVDAAIRATSSMVCYAGDLRMDVVRAHPEVVLLDAVDASLAPDAWVFGPGIGTGQQQREELSRLVDSSLPLVIDADGITALAQDEGLRTAVRGRSAATVLTPHAGEFSRLAQAMEGIADPQTDPINAAQSLSRALECTVLLKGRFSIIATDDQLSSIDAATSWAATAGSGDVLSGLLGARLAHATTKDIDVHRCVEESVVIHQVAAWLSALTPDGPAPTSASRIARYIPRATARTIQQ